MRSWPVRIHEHGGPDERRREAVHRSARGPREVRHAFAPIVTLALALLAAACHRSPPPPPPVATVPALVEHTREFRREIIRVTDGVWVAVGFGLANAIQVEGPDGRFIVDTLESVTAAQVVRAEFDKLSDKPIRAVIYTHHHPDHVYGAAAFAASGDVAVYAHDTTAAAMDHFASVVRPIQLRRSAHMYGTALSGPALENLGIGPLIPTGDEIVRNTVRPTVTFHDRLETSIAGVKVVLQHAPGETNDQLFVWLPERRVLLPGDNFYKAFPNLYTIRGTAWRDPVQWVRSLDAMRDLAPAFLVPSHTRPLDGEQLIQRTLTDYRDALQYIHDQTVRGMNAGLSPDELVERVHLPPRLASSPCLQEFYGTVAWSVRAVFDGYLGWFNGRASALNPLLRSERARRVVELAGGRAALLAKARNSEAAGDHQWVLELTDALLDAEPPSRHGEAEAEAEARQVRIAALEALGAAQANPNARHWYFTEALELRDGKEVVVRARPTADLAHGVPLAVMFPAMATHLHAEDTLDRELKVNFEFRDSSERFSMHVRRGVVEVQARALAGADVTFRVTAPVWQELLGGVRSFVPTIATGELEIVGDKAQALRFLGWFKD